MKVGDMCYFGDLVGKEQTLGMIIKVNKVTVNIRQIGPRMGAPKGTNWLMEKSMVEVVENSKDLPLTREVEPPTIASVGDRVRFNEHWEGIVCNVTKRQCNVVVEGSPVKWSIPHGNYSVVKANKP